MEAALWARDLARLQAAVAVRPSYAEVYLLVSVLDPRLARWAGWFAIAFGLSAGAVVGRNVPMMVHIPLLIIAVLLLKR